MIAAGTEVTSVDCPGATGVISVRHDSDDGVICLVSWVTATGQTAITWHREGNLIPGSQKNPDTTADYPDVITNDAEDRPSEHA